MPANRILDAIIIGGSYAGLAAGMALGRAFKKVLIIDDENPCNRQTPYSHNFITQDGIPPNIIGSLARKQVERYSTVQFLRGIAAHAHKKSNHYEIFTSSGESYNARKLIFATGIKDILPDIAGFAESWGISFLHCPFCHGYEVRNKTTGIVGNGENGYELCKLVSNWTNELTLFTNGPSTLTIEQNNKLKQKQINIIEKKIIHLEQIGGNIQHINFSDNTIFPLNILYARNPFELSCKIPVELGCELTEEGYIKVNNFQETTVGGIYACGDITKGMRTVANAVATGTTAGMDVSKKIIMESF
jgi:thioredoxin reductase